MSANAASFYVTLSMLEGKLNPRWKRKKPQKYNGIKQNLDGAQAAFDKGDYQNAVWMLCGAMYALNIEVDRAERAIFAIFGGGWAEPPDGR